MGLLVDGVWQDQWYDTRSTGGRFIRSETQFRDQITADGSSGFQAASGRYHLYVARACPWAHRALIFRSLKGLQEVIGVSYVAPLMLDKGWVFGPEHPDTLLGKPTLAEIYKSAKARYSGRVTVPLLWDRERCTIVNNESSELIRMFNRAFDAWATPCPDLCPPALLPAIDAVNARIYQSVNNGVYRAGFATTQSAYDEAVGALFQELERLELLLGDQPWLCGSQPTEADWRLFTTLIRFDPIYHHHFKCNHKRLVDFPNLWSHTRALYQVPGVRQTVHRGETRLHYYGSHPSINPHGVVPTGPVTDLDAPHDRPAWPTA